jgi:hypothetical protein
MATGAVAGDSDPAWIEAQPPGVGMKPSERPGALPDYACA